MQVLLAVDEVQGGEEHLTADQAVGGQGPVVMADEMGLPDCGDGLQHGWIGRAGFVQTQDGETGGNRSARDHHHPIASLPQGGYFPAQFLDVRRHDGAVLIGQRRRADLGHDQATRARCHPATPSSGW